jgi:hypothetical protein
MISENAMRIIKEGRAHARVKRSGMLQQLTFTIKKVKAGQEEFVELFTIKVIDMSELTRLANEFGLPVEAENGRAFPEGKGAKDFIGL